jgi:hypothetical protein
MNGFYSSVNSAGGSKSMTKSRKVVLWGREGLLSSSVELFLKTQKGWHVTSVPYEEKIDGLLVAVDKVHPDVVIIHQRERSDNSQMPMKLLQKQPGLKVITINPNDNLLEVYSKQNIMVKSASDLISVVEADPIKPTKQ